MTEASSVNYSSLNHTLLAIKVPSVTNCFDVFEHFLETIDTSVDSAGLKNTAKRRACEHISKISFFKENFERYFDPWPPFQFGGSMLSGSFSEGLFLYTPLSPPDMDYMCALKGISFTQQDQENGSLMLREDTPFVYALIKGEKEQKLWSQFLDDTDRSRLSSRKLKDRLRENYQRSGKFFHRSKGEHHDEVGEGAAMTIHKIPGLPSFTKVYEFTQKFLTRPLVKEFGDIVVDLEFSTKLHDAALWYHFVNCSDVVLSILCEGWPSCATEWITRKRIWPHAQLVKDITQRGFHIVPKSSPDGDFRLSFSRAETILVKALNPLQHKVMRAFKAVVKYHDKKSLTPSTKGIMSSYHLKTVAFWYFEKSSEESWTEEALAHHLVTLLEELKEVLRKQNLPMYFMPKVNLFKDIGGPEITEKLKEGISQFSHDFTAISKAVKNMFYLYYI